MNLLVSVLMVDYHKADRLKKSVELLQRQKTNFAFEVLIADNSCDPKNSETLKALEAHSNVEVFLNPVNRGYIRANNQLASLAHGKYLVLINPDIECAEENTLQMLVDYMESHPGVGLCGPQQKNESDGRVAMTVRAFPQFPIQIARRTFLRHLPGIRNWVAHDEMQHLDYSKEQQVPWLQSSFWVTPRALWNRLGGLNEDYFIFMSDPDFCQKIWAQGLRVMYLPQVKVQADGVRCSEGGVTDYFKKWTLRQHVRDAWKYRKNHLFTGDFAKK